jgi:hypothetical protein
MGWVVSVTPRPRFTPGERTPGTNCTGGWMGPRAGLDTEVRGKILCPCRRSNLDLPVVQPVVRHCTSWANPVPRMYTCSSILICFLTSYYYGVVSYKASHALQPFSYLFFFSMWVLIAPEPHTRALWFQQSASNEAGRWRKISLNLADAVSLSYSSGFFNMA